MRIEVEPQELITAGEQIGALGTQLGMLSNAMGQALASGIASGNDPAGLDFGIAYGRQADEFAKQLADAANAFTNVGRMLEATGYNYRNSDAASVIGGPGASGGVSGEPGKTQPGDAPYGPNGATVPAPAHFYLIQPLLNAIPGLGTLAAMAWPNGNSALMNVTAAQWHNLAQGLSVVEPAMAAAKGLAGAANIPESGDINKALTDLGSGVTTLSALAGQLGSAIGDYATNVRETQDAVRRLLDRLTFEGLWDTLTGFLTGEGDDILREIARDVGSVLENFQREVKGLVGLLGELGILLGEAASALQTWIRPVLVGVFGDQHGNVLADAVTFYTDVQVGSVIALLGAVADTIALADPETWKGMADMALSIAKDPSTIDDVLLDMGKEFIALDQIQGDHPGRGIGAAGFNIASLFIPGGALSKTGTLAKGLSATRGLFRDGLPGSLGRLPGLGGNTPNMPELPDVPAAPDIPEIRSPGVPESVLAPGGLGPGSSGSPSRVGDPPMRPTAPGTPNGAGPGGGTPNSTSPNGSGASDGSPGAGDPPSAAPGAGAGPSAEAPNSSGPSPSASGPSSSGGSSGSGVPMGGDGPGGSLSNGVGSDSSSASPSSDGASSQSGSGSSPGNVPSQTVPDSTAPQGGEADGSAAHAGNGAGSTGDGSPGADDPPNNPPHTGLYDPPANHAVAGDRLPDLTELNNEFRAASGAVDADRFDEWAERVSDAYPNISPDGVKGVYDYTTENYQGMNPYLRDLDPLTDRQQVVLGADSVDNMSAEQRVAWEERIQRTDEGLAALPPYREDLAEGTSITWRGLHASDDLLAQLERGGIFSDPAYLSTSIDSTVAEQFALTADPKLTPTVLSVEGYDGVDVSALSRYTDEAEILFPRGSEFEVIHRELGDDGVMRIYLRQVQP